MERLRRPKPPPEGWRACHLLSVDDLTDREIRFVIDLAEYYADGLRRDAPAMRRLAGKTQINLFYEDSTRTNLSFDLAGRKLGADVLNVPVAASSVNKGEALIDTAQTLAAMGARIMIVRHPEPGVHRALAERLPCPVVNAGDGVGEHPTQALLDATSIRAAFGTVAGLTIAICGDIKHSRVAGSNARLLHRLGADIRFVGPAHLMPDPELFPDIGRFDSLEAGLANADVAIALRMQFERMHGEDEADAAARGYFDTFGLSHETISYGKPGLRVMHPGPMNRGVEIDGALADDPSRSLVLDQVFYGVATRMAILDAFMTGGAL
ncbi:MAG: aspartate carbamoyltransferase catalytic subunit [Pseudomonadota bacterium]